LIEEFASNGTMFDIIIDDGAHTLPTQNFFLREDLCLLKPAGILSLEDIEGVDRAAELLRVLPERDRSRARVVDFGPDRKSPDDILLVLDRSDRRV
jgi:hypothetical protein